MAYIIHVDFRVAPKILLLIVFIACLLLTGCGYTIERSTKHPSRNLVDRRKPQQIDDLESISLYMYNGLPAKITIDINKHELYKLEVARNRWYQAKSKLEKKTVDRLVQLIKSCAGELVSFEPNAEWFSALQAPTDHGVAIVIRWNARNLMFAIPPASMLSGVPVSARSAYRCLDDIAARVIQIGEKNGKKTNMNVLSSSNPTVSGFEKELDMVVLSSLPQDRVGW